VSWFLTPGLLCRHIQTCERNQRNQKPRHPDPTGNLHIPATVTNNAELCL